MAKPPPPNMSSQLEVVKRIKRGERANTYTELVDLDEVEGLNDAYLALQDGKFPPKQPVPPLTSDDFKHYVQLVYEAIRSTEAARDAFETSEDGKSGKSLAMEYIESIGMFETQLVAGKLVKAVHSAQCGIVTLPIWNQVPGVKIGKYDTFAERMNGVIEALKVWKMFGWALFADHMTTMERRLALQPQQEMRAERVGRDSNSSPFLQLQFASSILPEMPRAAAAKTDGGGKHHDKHNDKDDDKGDNKDGDKEQDKNQVKDQVKEQDADTSGKPAPASKKRKHRNSDAAPNNPSRHSYGTRSSKKQRAALATAAPAASPAASSASKTAGTARPATPAGAASTPVSRPRTQQTAKKSVQPPTPDTASAPLSVDKNTTPEDGDRDLRDSTQTCNAKHLPGQPSRQQSPPPPDYQASQLAFYEFQERNEEGDNLPTAAEYFGALEAQWEAAKALTGYQNEGGQRNFNITGSLHGPDASAGHNTSSSVIHGGFGGVVVNNYFQPHTPSPPGDPSPAGLHNGSEKTVDYYFGPDNSQSHEDNHSAFQRDSPFQPLAPANTPEAVYATGHNSQQQHQVNPALLPFGILDLPPFVVPESRNPPTYALPPRSAPPAAVALDSTAARPSAPAAPPSSGQGWSLNLAGENPTDARAIADCRRIGHGLRPQHTTGRQHQQSGAAAGPRPHAPAPRHDRDPALLNMTGHTPEEQKAIYDYHRISMGLYPVYTSGWRFQEEEPDAPYAWVGPPAPAADDNDDNDGGDGGFVPFREASEEWEYDFVEKARNDKKKKEGDKGGEVVEGHTDQAPNKSFDGAGIKITRVVSTLPRYEMRTVADKRGDRGDTREEGSSAVRSATTSRVPTSRVKISQDTSRRSCNQTNDGAGDEGELREDRDEGSRAARPARTRRTPTKRYRINPYLRSQ